MNCPNDGHRTMPSNSPLGIMLSAAKSITLVLKNNGSLMFLLRRICVQVTFALPNPLLPPHFFLSRKKMVVYDLFKTTDNLMWLLLKTDTHFLSFLNSWINSRGPSTLPNLMCDGVTIICRFAKEMSGRLHFSWITVFSNLQWCFSGSQTHQPPSKHLWMTFYMILLWQARFWCTVAQTTVPMFACFSLKSITPNRI